MTPILDWSAALLADADTPNSGRPDKTPLILGLVFLGLGLAILAGWGLYIAFRLTRLRWSRVPGVVVDAVEIDSESSVWIVRFTDPAGEVRKFRDTGGGYTIHRGDSLWVRFDPGNPARAEIERRLGAEHWIFAPFFGFSAFFIGITLLCAGWGMASR